MHFDIGGGCDIAPSVPAADEQSEPFNIPLSFSSMSTGISLSDSKAKSGSLSSSFGCFLSVLNTDEEKPYPFWSIYLHYPEEVVQNAGNNRSGYKYRLKNSDGEIYLMANCIIPGTAEGLRLVDQLLRDSIRHYEKKNESNKSYSPSLAASAGDWCSQANSEGFFCQPGDCWLDSGMNTCCGPDGCGFPEVEVVSEIEECTDCGDVPIPWSPPELEDPEVPWNPDDPGSGGEPCLDCEPGDDPNDPGDNDENEQEPCDTIGEEGCEELNPCDGDTPPDYCSEPDLCLGDPLPNPEITPSNGWNVRGGMFGPTRNCDSTGLNCDFHDGIDISAALNSPLYSMHPGTVVERRDPPMDPGEYDRRVRTWGNYVIIESEINGEIIRFRYAHLNEMHVPVGTTVYAGQQIGLTGNTGNAQSTRRIKVLPHVHVQARKVVNGQESKVDPNGYMSTKFNSNGTINTSESSCD